MRRREGMYKHLPLLCEAGADRVEDPRRPLENLLSLREKGGRVRGGLLSFPSHPKHAWTRLEHSQQRGG